MVTVYVSDYMFYTLLNYNTANVQIKTQPQLTTVSGKLHYNFPIGAATGQQVETKRVCCGFSSQFVCAK